MNGNVPAQVGMHLEEIDTPCLMVDLDALERNIETLRRFVSSSGVRLRTHAKTHKSVDIAKYQIAAGGACGVCCQKVSEAEALVDGGITDVLVSNEVVGPRKIDRLASLAKRARLAVCVDDLTNVAALSVAAQKAGATIGCLVELDVGAGRCGIAPGPAAVDMARAVAAAPGLVFLGLQAYHGPAQHVRDHAQRRTMIEEAVASVTRTIALLQAEGLECATIAGAGTGTYEVEGTSGVYNELQCGSYIFMDADYQRNRDERSEAVATFANSLFVYTSVMSKAKAGKAVCDAGLKAHSVDSGLPTVFGRSDVTYLKASDEHGLLDDPDDALRLGEKLKLVPGHCDPTVNLYDCYVAVRNDRVEAVWPVSARGMLL